MTKIFKPFSSPSTNIDCIPTKISSQSDDPNELVRAPVVAIYEFELVTSSEDDENGLAKPGPMADGRYTVKKVVDKRINKDSGVLEYLVKWVGWSSAENTWETLANLRGSERLIKDYEVRKQLKMQLQQQNIDDHQSSSSNLPSASPAPEEAEKDAEVQEKSLEEDQKRKAAIAAKYQALLTSTERKIVKVRSVNLGDRMSGTQDVFDVMFDCGSCIIVRQNQIPSLSDTNRRFIADFYKQNLEKIAALKKEQAKKSLALALSLMPPESKPKGN